MATTTLFRGEIWTGRSGKTLGELAVIPDGGLAVTGGKIETVDHWSAVQGRFPQAPVEDFRQRLLLPTFVDAHLHFPQIGMIGRAGKNVLDWLERHTFPEEARFRHTPFAESAAEFFVGQLLTHGIGTAAIYSSSDEAATHALFAAAERKGLRVVIGKVSMDRHAPAELLQAAAEDLAATERLIARWHGKQDRLYYALTPRFAPTCSESLLQGLGALRQRHPSLYVQSHLSEAVEEIAWVKALFPHDVDYLAVYERFGLCGPRTLYGHGLHLTSAEIARLAKSRTAIVHCPTSNLFLGSGLFPLDTLTAAGVPLALGSDVGGGTSLSPWRTMATAHGLQRLRGKDVSPGRLLSLATLEGATALGLETVVGSLEAGKAADFLVLDPARVPFLPGPALDAEQRLSGLIHQADERVIQRVYVNGLKVSP